MKVKRSSRTVIGVDIGQHTIKAVQLQTSGTRYRVFALLLMPRPQPGQEIGPEDVLAVKQSLKRYGFGDNRIVIAAPDQILLRATLEVPAKVVGASAEQVIRMELSRQQNVAPDSFEMAYWEFKAANNLRPMTPTLAVGCPHAAANALLDLFEEARVAAWHAQWPSPASRCSMRAPQIMIVDLPRSRRCFCGGRRRS
jgi:Tfp pilus assembly PilM family ATPase